MDCPVTDCNVTVHYTATTLPGRKVVFSTRRASLTHRTRTRYSDCRQIAILAVLQRRSGDRFDGAFVLWLCVSLPCRRDAEAVECALGCGALPPGVEAAVRLMTPEEARRHLMTPLSAQRSSLLSISVTPSAYARAGGDRHSDGKARVRGWRQGAAVRAAWGRRSRGCD